MRSERNVRKSRVCRSCHDTLMMTADGMKQHATTCVRMKRLGLVMPDVVVPSNKTTITRVLE